MKVAICTLGCRTNIYESDSITSKLKSLGFEIVDFNDFADVYIVNTCSVTQEADKKSRQMIRRGKHQNPDSYVISLGCFSQLNYDDAKSIGCDYVCGNRNKEKCIDYILKFRDGLREEKIDILDLNVASYENNKYVLPVRDTVKAYIKIGDGCDNHCAYCIIREARGKVVSRSLEDIYAEGVFLSQHNFKEVILTGIEVASYGKDKKGLSLIDAVNEISKVDGIERIRLASLEPSILKKDFILSLANNPKFAPSFHLSLQSGSSEILAKMKRKYNSNMVKESVDLIKQYIPNATFSADIICGFPGETDKDFEETVEMAKYIKLYHGHIFPYSDRKGTLSSEMKDKVKSDIKKERCKYLSQVCEKTREEICLSYVNTNPLKVLFEQRKGGYYIGDSENGLEVLFESKEDLKGKIVENIPYKYENGKLYFKSNF